MKIAVCIKQVPEVADEELELDDGRVDTDDLVPTLNEWDAYALEEAVRISEAHGGRVVAVTLGDDEAEDELRRALAMGAHEAVRIDAEDYEDADGIGIARGLAAILEELAPELILTGAQSADTGWGQVGPALAALLGWPHATLAVGIEVGDGALVVQRELEDNTAAEVALELPAVVTVQTGLNEPRYVSVMGIRKVRGVSIDVRAGGDPGRSAVARRTLSLPERSRGGERLEGSLDEVCTRAAQAIRTRLGR